MASDICRQAINDAFKYGNALLKFISPNDAGATGSHQSGILIPKAGEAWRMFTPDEPIKGLVTKHPVRISWHDGSVTDSVVTWYGRGTRSEYRLTRFGKGFSFLKSDAVGDLLVLIPKTRDQFLAYTFQREEDIQEVIAALGVESFERAGIYSAGKPLFESADSCIEDSITEYAAKQQTFPSGAEFSRVTRNILEKCNSDFLSADIDSLIMNLVDTEYRLFQKVEQKICMPDNGLHFETIDEFLKTGNSILNRKKSRAGHSLENHVDYILTRSGVPHEMQPEIDGRPDAVIPDRQAYDRSQDSQNGVIILGIKTTCKDRWRQVLNEGKKMEKKYILTLQPGISSAQLNEMHEANVTLVVPDRVLKFYPSNHSAEILKVAEFVDHAKSGLNSV